MSTPAENQNTSPSPKQRTILIGISRDPEDLDAASEQFIEKLQEIIDQNNMQGVTWRINTQPDPNTRDEETDTVVTRMFAKVTWPAVTVGSRVGTMELQDLLDAADLSQSNPLPPM